MRIPVGLPREGVLDGSLAIPFGARALVAFAHGSGSSRHSPRNRFVAAGLHRRGLATLLLDLLTEDEEAVDRYTGELRFDIALLARRLVDVMDWLAAGEDTRRLHLGLFGASTGAAAALLAARARSAVGAVVSRGGRPDLALSALEEVATPTLLIVGGEDLPVLHLNREALARLHGVRRLEVIAGATHLFEEPGALEEVTQLAANWFVEWLAPEEERAGA